MWTPFGSEELFSEANLFTRGAIAGDLAFVAQDGRVASGEPADPSVEAQARRTLANLGIDLKTTGLDLENIVSLMVYLPGYEGAGAVVEVLADTFGENRRNSPAISLIGIAGLEAGCRVRMDAIATSNRDLRSLKHSDLPLAQGSLCHGVRVGNFVFCRASTLPTGKAMSPRPWRSNPKRRKCWAGSNES